VKYPSPHVVIGRARAFLWTCYSRPTSLEWPDGIMLQKKKKKRRRGANDYEVRHWKYGVAGKNLSMVKTHLGPLELPLLMCFITIMHLNSYLNPGCLTITL